MIVYETQKGAIDSAEIESAAIPIAKHFFPNNEIHFQGEVGPFECIGLSSSQFLVGIAVSQSRMTDDHIEQVFKLFAHLENERKKIADSSLTEIKINLLAQSFDASFRGRVERSCPHLHLYSWRIIQSGDNKALLLDSQLPADMGSGSSKPASFDRQEQRTSETIESEEMGTEGLTMPEVIAFEQFEKELRNRKNSSDF